MTAIPLTHTIPAQPRQRRRSVWDGEKHVAEASRLSRDPRRSTDLRFCSDTIGLLVAIPAGAADAVIATPSARTHLRLWGGPWPG